MCTNQKVSHNFRRSYLPCVRFLVRCYLNIFLHFLTELYLCNDKCTVTSKETSVLHRTCDWTSCILSSSVAIPQIIIALRPAVFGTVRIWSGEVLCRDACIHVTWLRLLYSSSLMVTSGGACGVMVIVVGNGHCVTSSNPGRDSLHFT